MLLRSDRSVAVRRWSFMLVFGCLAAMIGVGGCERAPGGGGGGESKAGETPPKVVAATFYPTAYFAERIASGTPIKVVNPCPPDADPADWKPSREAIETYRSAGLIILNGASFEGWVASASLPTSRVVDTTAGLKDALLAYEGVTHSHGSGGQHTHHGTDGHTWVDPKLAVGQASAIRDAMARAWPEYTTAFDAGLQALLADLQSLDTALQEVTVRLKGTRLMASHPAYGYLAKRYGWAVVNQDLPPDEEPSAGQWAGVSRELSALAGGVKVMLFEEEPLAGTSAKLASLGVRSIVFDPCEQPSPEGDYIARMRKNIEGLGSALVEAVTPHTATPGGGA